MASDAEPVADQALRLAMRVIRILEDLDVASWLGGSLASSIFGIPRATQDADLVADLRLAVIPAFVEALGEDFYADRERIAHAVHRRSSFNVIHLPTMFKVDVFVLSRDSQDRLELGRRRNVEVEGLDRPVPVASPEDVILHKLKWFEMGGGVSDRQWNDARGVLQVQGDRLDLSYLRKRAEVEGVGDLLEELLRDLSQAEKDPYRDRETP